MTIDVKLTKLNAILRELSPLAVAYSGGVDSTFLLRAAVEVLGTKNVLGVIGDSPSIPRRELEQAKSMADAFGAPYAVIYPQELQNPHYVANPPNRCYHCKSTLFTGVRELAAARGIPHLADGNNADDADDWRPGRKAAAELGVRSPLLEVGLTKAEIRELSRRFGLPTAEKPAMACLASRLPYGTEITAEILERVEQAEQYLHSLGFGQLRVRHHGDVARIEVAPADIPRLAAEPLRAEVSAKLRELGYRHIALDLVGYRTGSMNAVGAGVSPA